jgi:hypothetical protein
LSAKRTVLIISIIEVIAIVVIIVSDIFVGTVVPNDDHVPESQESAGLFANLVLRRSVRECLLHQQFQIIHHSK